MKVLHHVQSLDVTQGGLAVAVADLCSALSGLECRVLLTEAGHSATPVEVSGQVEVHGLGISNALWAHFLPAPDIKVSEEITVVHQHGLWSRSMRKVAAFARDSQVPLVVSPHGMIEPWALTQNAFRKRVALKLYQNAILEQAKAFHATSDAEASHIRRLGFSQPIAVIPNSVPHGWEPRFSSKAEVRTAVFLSRLHPKKGIEMLLDAWAEVSPVGWKLKVFGSGDASYLAKIEGKIQRLELGAEVSLEGPVYGDEKWKAFGEADVFILPSYSENFGLVVVEALKSGTPVITTNQTPWKRIEGLGCGWCVAPRVEALSAALENVLSKSRDELAAMGQIGARFADENFSNSANAEKMKSFYLWLSEGGERPSFVLD